jgi:hypothetical protein
VRSGGDPALLDLLAYAPAPARRGQLHLAIRLGTGRFHQIRAICADLGAPLVGDTLYGGSDDGAPYLEHACFRYPLRGGGDEALFDAHAPGREPIDAAVLAALAGLLRPG